jgi:asparagine synthase (glutamine-hydrolysing)
LRRTAPALPGWIDGDFARRHGLAERLAAVSMDHLAQLDQRSMALLPAWPQIFSLSHPGFSPVPIDVRYPFFDIRLLEFAARVPPWLLVGKRLLRQAMRGAIPEAVLQRPKTPLGYMRERLAEEPAVRQWRERMITRVEQLDAFVDRDRAAEALSSTAPGSARALERLVALAYWMHYRSNQPLLNLAERTST